MAFVMGATMAGIMLLFMLGMYTSRSDDCARHVIHASDDPAPLDSHLTSERSELTDLRVLELADEVILAQRREIAEMSWLIDDIDDNGKVTTKAELEERPVPEFEVSNGRDELATGE